MSATFRGPKPLMPKAPLSIETIEYDFEDFVLKHGIPETVDPLPYRKANSVFATGDEAEPVLTSGLQMKNNCFCVLKQCLLIKVPNRSLLLRLSFSRIFTAKHDPRLRTVVCRHWLRDLCMKGNACEFLHEYNLSKMPLCRKFSYCFSPENQVSLFAAYSPTRNLAISHMHELQDTASAAKSRTGKLLQVTNALMVSFKEDACMID